MNIAHASFVTATFKKLKIIVIDHSLLRWGSSFIFVVGVYAAAVFTALNWPMNNPIHSTQPMAAMMIDLAPMPVAPQVPPSAVAGPVQNEAPPPPEPVPEVEPEIEPLPELPVIEKAEAVLPRELPPEFEPKLESEPIEKEPEPIEELTEEQIAQEDKAPPTFESLPDEVVAAPMEGAVSLESSQAISTWQSVLLGHLERHKRYPRKARRNRHEAIVYVRITINRDGTVVDYRLETPSAYKILNQETLALIARAQPLPSPPPEVLGETVKFVVPVEFFLKK